MHQVLSKSYGYDGAFDNNKKIISVGFMHGSRIESDSMQYAFSHCDNLKSVLEIPSSVTDMGYTFIDCSCLKRVLKK